MTVEYICSGRTYYICSGRTYYGALTSTFLPSFYLPAQEEFCQPVNLRHDCVAMGPPAVRQAGSALSKPANAFPDVVEVLLRVVKDEEGSVCTYAYCNTNSTIHNDEDTSVWLVMQYAYVHTLPSLSYT